MKSDGTVWSWGYNNKGQIGNGTITVNELSPVQATGLTGVVSVAAGYEHTVALKSDGTVWTWGYNNYGQLGDGTTTDESSPVQVSGLTGVIAIAAGYEHTVALKSDGTVWAWGYNTYGQLGDNTIVSTEFARAGVRADRRCLYRRRSIPYGRPEVRRLGLGLGI